MRRKKCKKCTRKPWAVKVEKYGGYCRKCFLQIGSDIKLLVDTCF